MLTRNKRASPNEVDTVSMYLYTYNYKDEDGQDDIIYMKGTVLLSYLKLGVQRQNYLVQVVFWKERILYSCTSDNSKNHVQWTHFQPMARYI